MHSVLVGVEPPARLERARIHRAHLTRERARGQALRQIQPMLLVLGRRDPAQEPSLRPGDAAGDERRLDAGQPAELAIDVREVLYLARGEAEPLPCMSRSLT